MKITIAPSTNQPGYNSVTIDLRTDDESTTEAVEAALDAIVAYGHSRSNVKEAALGWAETQRQMDEIIKNEL